MDRQNYTEGTWSANCHSHCHKISPVLEISLALDSVSGGVLCILETRKLAFESRMVIIAFINALVDQQKWTLD